MSITPASVSVNKGGGKANYTVNFTRTLGFNGAIALSISSLPSGATAVFNKNPTTANSSKLTITVAKTTAAGTYPFTVTADGGSPALTHTADATLVKKP